MEIYADNEARIRFLRNEIKNMKPQMKKFFLELLEDKYIEITTTKKFISEKLEGMQHTIDVRVKEDFQLKGLRSEAINIKLTQELE